MMDAIEFIKLSNSGKIDIVANTKKTVEECKRINKEYNYFIDLDEEYAMAEAKRVSKLKKGKLLGLPISVKDCICVKDMETRAGSKILQGYKPVFDATVIENIKKEGGVIIGKTSQDVFGFGSFNVNVGLGEKVPLNPLDKERATGGSSGGAAGITKKLKMPHIAISESTGGSISCPASYCGVLGFTPTYGKVSRYGLLDYANSLDKIGVIANSVEEISLMMGIISGYDEKDSTSVNIETRQQKTKKKEWKIAVVKESLGKGVEKEAVANLEKRLGKFKIDKISLPINFKYCIQAYYLISMSEASTNLAKYCGMRYGISEDLKGNFNEYFSKVRSNSFSKEEKRRIILGTFSRMSGFRDAFYLKALKVRTKIINEYKEAFKKYDLIVTPTMPGVAPRFSEISKFTPLQNYMMDIMTAGPNLAGLPHISIPSGEKSSMPTGLQLMANHFEEEKILEFAKVLG